MSYFLSFVRFAARAPPPRFGFLTYEESRTFIQRYGFLKLKEFLSWSKSGARPAFIPSDPARSYRYCGWSSWPDWLGYERTVKEPAQTVARERSARANEAKAVFFEFVSEGRPDMEFRELPKTLKASHLFRIRSCSTSVADAEDSWLPVQIRFSSPIMNPERKNPTERHLLRQTADEETPVIFISPSGDVLMGRCGELPPNHCKPSDFVSRDTVFERLETWWATSDKASATELVRHLRERGEKRGIFGGPAFLKFQRVYLDALGLSWRRSGDVDGIVNAIVGERYRMMVRQVCHTDNTFYVKVLNAANESRSGPANVSHDFDFLLLLMPLDCAPDEDDLTVFLFPKRFLADTGVLASDTCRGRETLHLYPPSKICRKTVTDIRKEEQAPYFVDSAEKFLCVLQRFGSSSSVG